MDKGQEPNEKQQEIIFKLSMLEQQMQQVQEQIESVSRGVDELSSLNFGLDDLRGSVGKEILAPLGRGIFVGATVNSEALTVDLGGKIFVQKSVAETKEIIEGQVKKLLSVKDDLNSTLEKISEEAEKTLREFQAE